MKFGCSCVEFGFSSYGARRGPRMVCFVDVTGGGGRGGSTLTMLVWTEPVAYKPKAVPSDAPTTTSRCKTGFPSAFGVLGEKKNPGFLTEEGRNQFFSLLFR